MKALFCLKNQIWSIGLTISFIFMIAGCDDTPAYEVGAVQNEMSGCQNDGEQVCNQICVNLLTDRLNCGQCGQVCPDGLSCQQGTCSLGGCDVAAGENFCDGMCVDSATNNEHCGACNRSCAGGSQCSNGVCECGLGLSLCIDECVNLNSDPNHCGACSAPCRNDLECVNGECKAERSEACNGEDDDLDGRIDESEDGTPLKIDCSNLCGMGEQICEGGEFTNCSAPKGTEEICDMQDNDCDGLVDEEISITYYADRDLDGYGSNDLSGATISCMGIPESNDPTFQYVANNQDCNDQNDQVYPNAVEGCDEQTGMCINCDQLDNNCDGVIDEGCTCMPNSPPQVCGSDIGLCQPGERACVGGVFGDCEGVNYRGPSAEVCNQQDDDCDGTNDEGMPEDVFEVLESRMNNDRCDVAHQLAVSISGETPIVVERANLNHFDQNLDRDWYVIQSTDNMNLCLPFISSQCISMELKFTHPYSVSADDYEVCLHEVQRARNACETVEGSEVRCISQPEWSTYDATRRTYTMSVQWQGRCGQDDSRYFAIEVFSPKSVNGCDTYDLSIRTSLENEDCPEMTEERDEEE